MSENNWFASDTLGGRFLLLLLLLVLFEE